MGADVVNRLRRELAIPLVKTRQADGSANFTGGSRQIELSAFSFLKGLWKGFLNVCQAPSIVAAILYKYFVEWLESARQWPGDWSHQQCAVTGYD
jgi:hypothetical protein